MSRRIVQSAIVHTLITAAALRAQSSRIISPLDSDRPENTARITLRGTLHPRALKRNDLGAVEPDFAMPGLTLRIAPSAAQQADLDALLAAQQNPKSPDYRRWLTPEQFADRFSASPSDIAQLSAWLTAQGFKVDHAARARNSIVFSGNASQVQRVFRTEIHRFRDASEANPVTHFANVAEPSLPAALDGIITMIGGLDDFYPTPASTQENTLADGSHSLSPDDIATIYNIAPLYQQGIDGTGQTIAIVGVSRPVLSDVQAFRTKFHLPAQVPQTVLVPGFPDPGLNSALIETDLDLEWTGAIARNASLVYVYSTSAFTALAYAVDQNLAPVISESFIYGCEQDNSFGLMNSYRTLAQQANAQGITWVNSAGDEGAAGCDGKGYPLAQNGPAVSLPNSIPEVTAVGGTRLRDSSPYWNATNDATGASAISYIPESVWNDTLDYGGISATGGGSSTFFFKPSWQSNAGSYRDVPDLAMVASPHTPYIIYYFGSQTGGAGTSGSTPVFAGMIALINQAVAASTGQTGSGNINPILYRLAKTSPAVFHDIVSGDNLVPCAAASPGCGNGFFGYPASAGYDLTTGLGSPDTAQLLQQWPMQTPGTGHALIVIATSKNPVYQQAPDALGNTWQITLNVTEEAGVGATVTSFLINGVQHIDFFSKTAIDPFGSTSVGIGFTRIASTITFTVSGLDANGGAWIQSVSVPFLGLPPAPVVSGLANAASFQTSFAPGMQMAIFGTQFTDGSPQGAATVPLLSYMDHFYAAINGVNTPLYYVSPGQVNVQIPYETLPGAATLTVISADGFKSATFKFNVASSAPGIFADGNGFTVPYRSGARGQTLTLFITGDGNTTPSLSTGFTPPPTTPFASLPHPKLPARLTIGGVDVPIQFIGIPSGLVGVTQINFTIPDNVPLGVQPVVVSIGLVDSPAANFTVTTAASN